MDTLPEKKTASSHLKMDGWNTRAVSFWLDQILLLVVSGSVSIWICKDTRIPPESWFSGEWLPLRCLLFRLQ